MVALLGTVLIVSGLVILEQGVVVHAATSNVNIQDVADPAIGGMFSPKTITISVGDTVQWTWTGSSQHSVTADDGSFDSTIRTPPTAPFMHQFNTAGTFVYYCQVHGGPGGVGMSGTVIVQAALPSDTPTSASTVTDTPAPTDTPVTNTATPGATQTPTAGPTETPGPSVTAGAAPVAPTIEGAPPEAAAASSPTAGVEATTQLPRTGDGPTQTASLPRLSLVLLIVGCALVGAAFGARRPV
jgi:plastocyanin